MAKKPKLKLVNRLEIRILLDKGYKYREIARSMGRSPNTISYEVEMNGGRETYNPHLADQYARTRRKDTRKEWSKIEHNSEMKTYIIQCLEKHWNPDEIAQRMKDEKKPWYASKTAIYDWLWSVYGQQYCVHLYSGRYHKEKRVKKTERVMIPERVGLEERPLGADNRTRYGHWENDTIVSRKGCSGGLSVGCERKSRLVVAVKVISMSTGEHMDVIRKQIDQYKTLSITFDNGIENKHHQSLGVPTFFCEPYSSWQKGGVENANKMIRRYFPKGTNFRKVSQKKIDEAIAFINNKPRKILGYKTALEVSRASGMMKGIISRNSTTVLIGG
jgi:transposase, IS30 family